MGLSQADVGRLAFGATDNSAFQSIRRGASPAYDRLKAIGDVLGFELYFGPTRVQEGPAFEDFNTWSEDLIRHRGMVACSIQGWASELVELKQLPRPVWLKDDGAFWVAAVGSSMVPEGIDPGDLCLISPSRDPVAGERVFVADSNGTRAIKRYLGKSGNVLRMRGWMPEEDGGQKAFLEERPEHAVRAIYPVAAVYRGQPGKDAQYIPDPRRTAGADDDVLQHVAAFEGFASDEGMPLSMGFQGGWLKSIGLNPASAALVEVQDRTMEPHFARGSIALVNTALKRVSRRAAYAVKIEGKTCIRFLEEVQDDTLIVTASDSSIPTSVLPRKDRSSVSVVGRVVWCGASLKD